MVGNGGDEGFNVVRWNGGKDIECEIRRCL